MPMGMGAFAGRVVATAVVATDGTGDFTDIQSAIDSLPAGGGVVYIKEGTYTITAAITITSSNVALIGAGRATIITTSVAADLVLLDVTSVSGILIDSIRFQGIGAAWWDTGIEFDGVTNSFIRNCWFDDCGGGIWLRNSSDNNIVDGNNSSLNFGVGIEVRDSDGVIVSNNACLTNQFSGILISSVSGSAIIGNVCWSNVEQGIEAATSTFVTITGNHCQSNTEKGIDLANSDNNVVSNNVCLLNDVGIRLDGSSTNNVVTSNLTITNTTTNFTAPIANEIGHNITS